MKQARGQRRAVRLTLLGTGDAISLPRKGRRRVRRKISFKKRRQLLAPRQRRSRGMVGTPTAGQHLCRKEQTGAKEREGAQTGVRGKKEPWGTQCLCWGAALAGRGGGGGGASNWLWQGVWKQRCMAVVTAAVNRVSFEKEYQAHTHSSRQRAGEGGGWGGARNSRRHTCSPAHSCQSAAASAGKQRGRKEEERRASMANGWQGAAQVLYRRREALSGERTHAPLHEGQVTRNCN